MNEIPTIRTLVVECIGQPHDPHVVLKNAFLIQCQLDELVARLAKRSFTDRLFHYLDQQIKSIATRK